MMDPTKGRHTKFKFIGDSTTLADIGVVRIFLETVVNRINMMAMDEPHCYSLPIIPENLPLDCEEDEGGVTGFVPLSTSHAAIHTFPEHCYAVVDVYSCKDYDPNIVEALIIQFFDVEPEELIKENVPLEFPFPLPTPSSLLEPS